METIFDYNITKREHEWIIGSMSKERYLDVTSVKGALIDLAYLFHKRGDIKKASSFINKTGDCNCINSFWRTVNHPHNSIGI